ncbi:MAG: hypothetical protein IT561_14265 [Alphaproteobacteria bacterium]|nr:hypothetical protein [Alphaproteobacteria bacterium]
MKLGGSPRRLGATAALLSVVLVGLIPARAAGQASDPRRFVCDVLSAAGLSDDGGLEATAYTRMLVAERARLTFDERSGVLVRELGEGALAPRRFLVLQRGGARGDVVARQIGATGSATYDVLRIVVSRPTMPFLYLEGDVVITGACRAD